MPRTPSCRGAFFCTRMYVRVYYYWGTADNVGVEFVDFVVGDAGAAVGPVAEAVKFADVSEAVFKAMNFYVATG